MECAACGKQTADDSRFCHQCGTPIPELEPPEPLPDPGLNQAELRGQLLEDLRQVKATKAPIRSERFPQALADQGAERRRQLGKDAVRAADATVERTAQYLGDADNRRDLGDAATFFGGSVLGCFVITIVAAGLIILVVNLFIRFVVF